jgi:hypothetical protein
MPSIFGNGPRPTNSRSASTESVKGEEPTATAETPQPSAVETAVAEQRQTGFDPSCHQPLASGERSLPAAPHDPPPPDLYSLIYPPPARERPISIEDHVANTPVWPGRGMHFDALPDDLQLTIRKLLDPVTLVRSMQVSHRWHDLGIDAVLWDRHLEDLHPGHQGAQAPQHRFRQLENEHQHQLLPLTLEPVVPANHPYANPLDSRRDQEPIGGNVQLLAELEWHAIAGPPPFLASRRVAAAWGESSRADEPDYQRLIAASMLVGHLAYSDRIQVRFLNAEMQTDAVEKREHNHQNYLREIHELVTNHGEEALQVFSDAHGLQKRVVEMARVLSDELQTREDPVAAVAKSPLIVLQLLMDRCI